MDGLQVIPEIKPTENIKIEDLIAETTKYCRYSGRLTWILTDWFIRNINQVNIEKLVEITRQKGDITVLGLISDIARQKNNDSKYKYIIGLSKPNDKKEIFFYRVAQSKLASKITIEQSLPIYTKWNYYCNELRYL